MLIPAFFAASNLLKSDQDGIEIFDKTNPNTLVSELKSDQDGIEILFLFLCSLALALLKSDQDGIEILSP